tara:strand:+ start:816 stop:983 length:168 start_codon:yes stop_codon:yes gene_type:complete
MGIKIPEKASFSVFKAKYIVAIAVARNMTIKTLLIFYLFWLLCSQKNDYSLYAFF